MSTKLIFKCLDQKSTLKNNLHFIVLFVIMLIGILGNLSVIVIVMKNKLLRLQVTNLFLLNMAISDLLNLTFNTVGYYFWGAVAPSPSGVIFNQYYLGENMCTATSFFTSNICTYILNTYLSL